MRIAIMGSGGTGGYFGGLLARSGADVTFIARGAHLAALRTQGLSVESRLVGDFSIQVNATDRPTQVGPVDLVLFCVKTYDTDVAAESLLPLMRADTVVLPLQNGIDSADQIARHVGAGHVMGGVALITAALSGPGCVVQSGGAGKIMLGELHGGASARAEVLTKQFELAGIPAQNHPDIGVAMWEKFVFVCAFGGITALTRLPIGPILDSLPCRELFSGVMKEVVTVAETRMVDLPRGAADRGMALAESFEPWTRGSLSHDLHAGRRLELHSLNGAVVRMARELSVPAPLNRAIYGALAPFAEGPPLLPTAPD